MDHKMIEENQFSSLLAAYQDLVDRHHKQAEKMTAILLVAIQKPDNAIERIVEIMTAE